MFKCKQSVLMPINEMINWYHGFFHFFFSLTFSHFFSLSYPRSRLILTNMGKSLENRKHKRVLQVETEMTMEIFSKGLWFAMNMALVADMALNLQHSLTPRV